VGPNFPTTKDAIQPATAIGGGNFIAKLDPTLHVLYATYFGAGNASFVTGLALDGKGFLYVAGSASDAEFPSKNAFQAWRGINHNDCFIAKLTTSGSLVHSTPLGGTGSELCLGGVAVNAVGNAFTAGGTYSGDFPMKNGYQSAPGGGEDGFVAKISDNTSPPQSPLMPVPSIINFRYTQGEPAPAPRTVTVGGGAFTSMAGASWMAATAVNGLLTITLNRSGLVPGAYSASVTLAPTSGTPAGVDVTLTVLAPIPVLGSLDPAFVAIGSDDLTVTLSGSGFTRDSQIQVDGIPWLITPVQFVNVGTLKFSMPRTYFSVPYNHANRIS
jgi:hypothetical protein